MRRAAFSHWHLALGHVHQCRRQTLHPVLADGLPGIAPSDRLRFSRLQLRGSAGIAPASLSSPRGKDAQTEGHFKERKIPVSGIYRGGAVEVNRLPRLVVMSE